ncbi:MAG: helix-turn-helix transcriptional regulator [Nitrososphaera sp.]
MHTTTIIFTKESTVGRATLSNKTDQGFLQMDDNSSSFGSSSKSKNNDDSTMLEGANEEQKSLSKQQHPFEKTEKTLFGLANADRLLILSQLQEGRYTLSGLSRQLGIVVQEIHRNINRLVEAGLVKKESGNSYSLTTLGSTTLMQLASIKFLADNSKYFSEHSLGELPAKYIQRVGALFDSTFLDNPVAVFEYQKDLIDNTEEHLDVVLPQMPSYLIEYVQVLLSKRRVKLRYLLPLNAVMPKKRHTAAAHPQFHQLLQEGTIQRRMVKTITSGVMINEKQALLMFSNPKGEVDMSNCFCSKSEQFHEWCAGYFEYIWKKQSRTFDSKMLVEV